MKLAYSKLTDQVYIVPKRGEKTNVTNDFLFCVITRWKGQIETITDSDGDKFEISVKEIKVTE